MSTHQLESIMNQVQQLTSAERLQLIKCIADSLADAACAEETPRYLIYGEDGGAPEKMSTEDDFRLAEWHPTEKQLNGE